MAKLFYDYFKKDANIQESFRNDMNLNTGSTSSDEYSDINSYYPSYIEKIEIGEAPSKTKKDNYIVLGPFQINRVNGAAVTSIKITDGNNTFEDGKNGGIEYTTVYGQEGNIWSNEIENIPSGKDFYLRIEDKDNTYNGSNWNVKFKSDIDGLGVYDARIMCSSAKGDSQNKLIYNAITQYSAEYDLAQKETSTLRVVKEGIDGSQKIRQEKVGFIINKEGLGYLKRNNVEGYIGREVQIGKMTFNETYFSWTNDRDNATIFETVNTNDGWNGYFQIANMPSGIYYIGEVYNHNQGYESSKITECKLERWEGESTLKEDESIGDIQENENVSGYTDYKLQVMNRSTEKKGIELKEDGYITKLLVGDSKVTQKEQFDINIKKINNSNKNLYGAEFKVKVFTKENSFIGWLKNNSTGYKYDTSYNNATIWSTSSSNNAQISINNLDKTYNYEIYETRAADGYVLSNQTQSNNMKVIIGSSIYNNNKIGYGDVDLGNNLGNAKLVFCGRVSYSQYPSGANLKVYNVTRTSSGSSYVDISGRVWEDTYKKSYNNVYDNGDTVLNGVTVYLKRKSDGKEMYSTTTSNGGIYTFSGSNTGITSSSLSNYYIEITDSRIGNTHRIVEYGTGANASKAKYQSSGRAWTDSIDSSNRLYMNIGIVALPTNEQNVEKWVKNVQVKMNVSGQNYSYTYTYGKNNSSIGGVGSVGIGSATYYRTIYASDIAYKKESGVTNALEVYITYTMKVANDTSTYDNPIVGGKRELNMTATVVDVYDSNYYILSDSNWTGSNGNARYKSTLTLNRKAKSGYYKELDITFKLTDKALNEILEKGSFTSGNRVEISGQHNYQIYEQIGEKPVYGYRWVGSGINIRRERYIVRYDPIYGWVNHNKGYDGENYAPGMTFSIYEYDSEKVAQRTITGKVFEDNNIKTDGQVLGNGKYDSAGTGKENLVNKVTVELIQANDKKTTGEDQPFAKRYIYDNTESKGYKVLDGETYTGLNDKTGIYEFSGIIPGDYYVRFTYGDGTQKIFKNNTPTGETVTAYEYKSTIVTNSTLKNLIQKDRNKQSYNSSEYYWYRNTSILSSSLQYSTAVDILGDREYLNNNKITTYDIRAYTPTFRISLENENTTSGKNESKKYLIENMNFGIIDTPKISLGFEKVMTNIRVTNASGQVIIDGNPGDTSQNIKYLSNLDNKTTHLTQPGSDYTKIEINDEEIYGAKLEITYSITILNDSDVNYYESSSSSKYGYYYMFGDSAGAKEVNITVDKVQDNLDEKLTLAGNDHFISNKDTYQNENNILKINGGDWKPLYTKKKAATNSRAVEDTATIVVTRILSNEDTNIDTTFENQAEVIKIHVTGHPNEAKLVENVNIHKSSQYNNYFNYELSSVTLSNPSEYNSLIVTPPTGADRMTIIIYIAIAAVAGIIITIGIIVIKKKVLNK